MISVAVPVIIILIGFVLIGPGGSTTDGGYGDNAGITFNPFQYFSRHGIEWSIAVLLISLFEIFWWKDHKNNKNK